MKKIMLILCLFLLAGCSNKIKVVHNDQRYQEEYVGSYPTYTYGLPLNWNYDIVETDSGYTVELIKGPELKHNEMYKNDEFTICYDVGYEDNSYRENRRTYYYVNDNKKTIIHENGGFIDYNSAKFPQVHTLNDKVYFSYYTDDYFIFNEIKDGKLIEIEKMLRIDGDFEFDSIVIRNNQKYYIYNGGKIIKYVFDEGTFEFKHTDRIIVLKDYIFYSTTPAAQSPSSYLINRETKEVNILTEFIDIMIDEFYWYNYEIDNNCFIFVKKDGLKNYYNYGEIKDNKLELVQFPFDFNYVQWTHELSENKIEVVIDNNDNDSNMDYYLVTIK